MQFSEMTSPCICIKVQKALWTQRAPAGLRSQLCVPKPVQPHTLTAGTGGPFSGPWGGLQCSETQPLVRCLSRSPVLTSALLSRTPSVRSWISRCEVFLAERQSLPCVAHLGMSPQCDFYHIVCKVNLKRHQSTERTSFAEHSAENRREKEDKLMGALPV